MESVNYEYFDSENDYSKNPNATKHRSLEWKSKFYILTPWFYAGLNSIFGDTQLNFFSI